MIFSTFLKEFLWWRKDFFLNLQAFQQTGVLRPGQQTYFTGIPGPLILVSRQHLVEKKKTVFFPKNCFHAIRLLPAEQAEALRVRFDLLLLGQDSHKSIDAFSHIRISADNVHISVGNGFSQHALSPPEDGPGMCC